MKHFFLFLVMLFFANILFAQYQIAVYHPADKTTKIAATFDSAYTIAQSGDYIYLPAGAFSASNPIAKKLNIIGVGIDPDSSLGITTFSSEVDFDEGSENSFIEGITFISTISASNNYLNFQRCYLYLFFGNGIASNINFNECNIRIAEGSSTLNSNWTFSKCVISTNIHNLTNSTFNNNIIGIDNQTVWIFNYVSNSLFYNNIFNGRVIDYAYNVVGQLTNCSFINNVNTVLQYPSQNSIYNDYTIPWASIFVNAKPDSVYQSNYHLKTDNPAINGGNDGTDVGIYGTGQPTKPGWVPNNPHVYYQKVTVDANGILHATFKVQPQTY